MGAHCFMTAPARKASINRRKSLQLSHHSLAAPIPPSLLQSPYLDPQSIFQRTFFAPHYPTEEDEKWLQDTVPLEYDKKRGRFSTSSTSSSISPTTTEASMQLRPRSIGPTYVPTSPPIVRWRLPCHTLSSTWHEPSRVRSLSSLEEQPECFESIRPAHIPTSPIVRWGRPRHIISSTWREPPRVRSAPPCLEEQHEFFACRP
ncbi:hypothetical protein C0995_015028 [Termitomyces sp. Mi166|nr:hypothetical protein C0995_015028 [Termitomyces sp. Mi166\